ncbi:MAG: penicillin-binding transpeptidase domain-containing protein [Burkholderiaceae bacterium]
MLATAIGRAGAEEERARRIGEQAAREQAEAAQHRAAFLAEASGQLAGSLAYEETLERAARLAVPGLADWCVALTIQEDRSIGGLAVAHTDPDREEAARARLRNDTFKPQEMFGIAKVLRTGRPELHPTITDAFLQRRIHDPDRLRFLRSLGLVSVVIVPLVARGRIIDALSHTLFDKAASGLDHREAALAAALVRAPNAPIAQVAERACGVWRLLQPGASDPGCLSMRMFAELAVQRRAYPAGEGIAPHLAQQVIRAARAAAAIDPKAATTAGSAQPANTASAIAPVITTTLDADLQRFAVSTLQRQLRELAGRHVEDGALVVLDNRSGAVLAWVGSSGALGAAPDVDGVTALRQPGSTLKPFLYAQALAERRLTAASLLEDAATHIPTAGGLYIPQNYDHRFKGWVSARTALAASLNVPAVRTLAMVSPQAFHAQLRQLDLPLRESGDYYGYSLALGSAEVSLLNLTNAYRALANQGRVSAVTWATPAMPGVLAGRPAKATVPSAGALPRQVLDPRAAFIVGDILSDSNARARTFGTDSILATRFWSAVKTGTSKDMRDNWAVGWSQYYTVGVWVGNASGAPMWDVSGISGAAPVWAAVMQQLHRNQSSRAPVPPAGVVRVPVRFGDGEDPPVEAQRQEWFIQGTQQTLFAVHAAPQGGTTGQAARAARIILPTEGTIIALDPDIPPAHQRLRLQTHAAGMRWLIDGRPVGKGPSASWLPWPGHHAVTLVDAQGQVRDSVRFEVRGASVKVSRAVGDGLR